MQTVERSGFARARVTEHSKHIDLKLVGWKGFGSGAVAMRYVLTR